MKDAAAAMISMKPVISAMNDLASTIAVKSKAAQEGRYFDLLPEDDRRIIGGAIKAWNMPLSDVSERNRVDSLKTRQREVAERLRQGGYSDSVTRDMRLKDFELRSGIDAANNYNSQPPIFSQDELDRWQEIDREHRRGTALSNMSGGRSVPGVPMPTA